LENSRPTAQSLPLSLGDDAPEKSVGNRPHSRRWLTSKPPTLLIGRGFRGAGAPPRGISFALDHEPLASVIENRQADCDSGAGHLLATIKPKIARDTIILSTNNLFLLTPPTSPSGRLANPAFINLSIQSSRSVPSTFRVIFFFGVEHVRCIFFMILQHDR
jgi:hypothetical protein